MYLLTVDSSSAEELLGDYELYRARRRPRRREAILVDRPMPLAAVFR